MNKKELSARIAENLKENKQKKYVRSKKSVFYITDDVGNKAAFELNQDERNVIYTAKDVQNILDAFFDVLEEAMQKGETVRLTDIGTFSMGVFKGKKFLRPDNMQPYEIPPKYTPKFRFSHRLKMAAKMYDLNHPITPEDLANLGVGSDDEEDDE